ncbi:hypothetical protein AB0436_28580 [Streptomyces sp. NPDC051322]|uniref:hypothetical protein n=1 Tax=Streptomyces sp. NPDC051322 TaxID=3154645 RepID=UPI003450760F
MAFAHTADGTDALSVPVPGLTPEVLDVIRVVASARMDVPARRRTGGGHGSGGHGSGGEEFFLPVTSSTERVAAPGGPGEFRVVHTAVARLAPDALNSGRNAGIWGLRVRITSCGRQRDTVLPVALSSARDGAEPVVLDGARVTLLRGVRRRVGRVLARVRARA